jgi:hypothetical protein
VLSPLRNPDCGSRQFRAQQRSIAGLRSQALVFQQGPEYELGLVGLDLGCQGRNGTVAQRLSRARKRSRGVATRPATALEGGQVRCALAEAQ